MGGTFTVQMVGQLCQSGLLFCFWLKKNTGLQGSILSSHRMTTGFGNIELPTSGLLQKGREHFLPKFCFAELASPAFWFNTAIAMGI